MWPTRLDSPTVAPLTSLRCAPACDRETVRFPSSSLRSGRPQAGRSKIDRRGQAGARRLLGPGVLSPASPWVSAESVPGAYDF